MNTPTTPFWFKQRQCKYEATGPTTIKVTGPNLPEAFLHIAQQNDQWMATVRKNADGPDVATVEAEKPNAASAWEAAFELYRTHFIA